MLLMKCIFYSISIIIAIISILSIYFQIAGKKPSVYWLNFKPESEKIIQELAFEYEERTGTKVNILTPETGFYNDILTVELQKPSPPTLFIVGSQNDIDKLSEYLYDLTNTTIASELNTNDFNLYTNDSKLVAIGYCYETFGLITNIELLEKAGYKIDEIKDFKSLKTIVEDIHANSEKLGFDAFTSSGLDDSSSFRFSAHLANVPLYYESRDDEWEETPPSIKGTYLQNYKNLWDLYIDNCPYKPDTLISGKYNAEEEFGKKQAVFYQNGNWEYDTLVNYYGLNPEKLTMIPLYSGVEGEEKAGLNSGTENHWAVNANASQEDIEATLDFMYWLVTDKDASKKIVRSFGSMPFKNSVLSDNIFLEKANQYNLKGYYTMTWAFNYTPNRIEWRKDIVSALYKYSIDRTGQNWGNFISMFTKSWRTQYYIINEE